MRRKTVDDVDLELAEAVAWQKEIISFLRENFPEALTAYRDRKISEIRENDEQGAV